MQCRIQPSGLYQLIVYQYDVMARHIVNAIAAIKDAIIVQKQLLHPTSGAVDLANGRQAIAEIANRVIDAGHPNWTAPSVLTDKATVKTDAYAKSRTAADAALNGSNISNSATQYRTRVGDNITTPVGRSSTNPETPVSQHYGPFIEGNHTAVIVVAQ